MAFLEGISDLETLKIPRNLPTQDKQEVAEIEIHSISEASMKCYGACVYLRVIYKNGDVSCNLITSKSRIAPIAINSTTIRTFGCLTYGQADKQFLKLNCSVNQYICGLTRK